MLTPEDEDDLTTLLWKADFDHIHYTLEASDSGSDLTERRGDGELERSIIKVTKAEKYGIKVSDYFG